jgi:hypothetical protein
MDPRDLKQWLRALSKAEASGDVAEEARVCNSIGTAYYDAGASVCAWPRPRHPPVPAQPLTRGMSVCVVGLHCPRSGGYKEALRYHRRDLALCRSVHDPPGEAMAHQNIGKCLARYGSSMLMPLCVCVCMCV